MKKRWICLLLALIMIATAFAGCGAKNKSDKISISMYLWDRSMYRQLTPYLEAKFPDIDFNFVQSYNTMDYYRDLISRGEPMPDIISCRRFSLNDAASLAPYLMDLSGTEVAGTFYTSYLDVNKEDSGAIRWLPACAEVDCIMANKTLFDQNNIPLPTNYAEFVATIDAFEALGIHGFQTDWDYDYTCMECLQGSAIPELMSFEGTQWRMAYESETEDNQVGLDNVVWPRVFEKFQQFLKDIRYEHGVTEITYNEVTNPFLEGKTAMIRSTAALAESQSEEDGNDYVMLPYFGENSKDNWILTYPMCQFAVSKEVEKDAAKKEAIMQVLLAIFSQEGQEALAAGTTVLSYNKNVNVVPSQSMRFTQDCIDRNHLYMRLASTETFAVSKNVVSKMLAGELDAKGAYDEYNKQITHYENPEAAEIVLTQDKAYSNELGEHGSPAASSFVNTMLAANEQEIAIAFGPVTSSPVYKGEYSLQQIKWLMSYKTDIYLGEYTGAEVRQLMEWVVNAREDGVNPIYHKTLMPVTGGMSYTAIESEPGKFRLKDLTLDGGEPLDENATYKVMIIGSGQFMESPAFCNNPLPEELGAKREDQRLNYGSIDLVVESLTSVGKLVEPTEYMTIVQK